MSLGSITNAAAERRENRLRLKLFGSIANTYGFAVLGASVAKPLLEGVPFTVWHVLGLVLGLSAHAVALILAPKGEANAD